MGDMDAWIGVECRGCGALIPSNFEIGAIGCAGCEVEMAVCLSCESKAGLRCVGCRRKGNPRKAPRTP